FLALSEGADRGGADGVVRLLDRPRQRRIFGLVLALGRHRDSGQLAGERSDDIAAGGRVVECHGDGHAGVDVAVCGRGVAEDRADRKSTGLNSSHVKISYAVFCLKKKTDGASSAWTPIRTTP